MSLTSTDPTPDEPKDNADFVSEAVFQDLKLHIEWNVDAYSNSGVYLRGRYEIQIESHDRR